MRVQFDYLPGPVMGHKMRCEILRNALQQRGHDIVNSHPDWLIVDYPAEDFPSIGAGAKRVKRLVMGLSPREDNDWAWHPLGEPAERMLCGIEYLILDPQLASVKDCAKDDPLLVTCGGSDPMHLTERFFTLLSPSSVVIGPGFGRELKIPSGWSVYHHPPRVQMLQLLAQHQTVVCGWGNTAFEAYYLGAKVIPIATREEHIAEGSRLGVRVFRLDELQMAISSQGEGRPHILPDLQGPRRVCEFLERRKGRLNVS